mmetsp:Transcript_30788/g.63251  ORF Transcript_30788/g.63251 Transcript_30788/m.63251 type:complete len:550 (-) Transcript_30788:176-1825(-)
MAEYFHFSANNDEPKQSPSPAPFPTTFSPSKTAISTPAPADTQAPPMPPMSLSAEPLHMHSNPRPETSGDGTAASCSHEEQLTIVQNASEPVISMDLLLDPLDDVNAGLSFLGKPNGSLKRITTSDFVKDVILSDPAANEGEATADTKVAAADPTYGEYREHFQSEERHEREHHHQTAAAIHPSGCPGCPVVDLTDAFGRITTGDLGKNCHAEKISSSDWNSGFQDAMRSRCNTGEELLKENMRISSSEWPSYLPLDTGVRSRLNTGDVSMGARSRLNTADDIMKENIRMTSSEWIDDYRNESMRSIGPSVVFEVPSGPGSNNASNSSMLSLPTIPPITSSQFDALLPPFNRSATNSPLSNDDLYQQLSAKTDGELHDMLFSGSGLQEIPQTPAASASSEVSPNPTSRNRTKSPESSKKSKKRKKRTIDISRPCEPTEQDVLFGRGGYTNTHPGNIKFREEALKLRPWYESSSKEEKYRISDLLVESVKSEGHRFLEKGSDGNWYEVIGNGARKKASQALRERMKKKSLSSSITSRDGGDDKRAYSEEV